jgi:hypothetical protein
MAAHPARNRRFTANHAGVGVLALSLSLTGCSAKDEPSGVQPVGSGGAGAAPAPSSSSSGEAPIFGGLAGSGPGAVTSVPPRSGCTTTLSGVTHDPAGRLPLYNVVVYVPSEPLAPLTPGASCETCDGNFSGRPIAATVSDAAGKFTLDISTVGTRANVPLVIQAGKWRRQVTVPAATDCADTPIDAELSRLPKNRAEGDLPRIAVMRAGSDALECLFTKIGVELGEFTPGGTPGAVELFYSDLENAEEGTGRMQYQGDTIDLPKVDALFSDYAALQSYDMVLLSCEGGDDRYDPPDLEQRENLQRYANEGGRLFGGHFHNGIIDNRELPDDYPEFPEVVEFADGRENIEPKLFTARVNTAFDKGAALADWLVNVGGSTTRGEIAIDDSERTVIATRDDNAVSWIDADTEEGEAALYYGFPTPVDGPACGRMVFTDVHVAAGTGDSGKEAFPSCSDELSPQQLALAFLIFDLANCVQPTESAPPPPPVIY